MQMKKELGYPALRNGLSRRRMTAERVWSFSLAKRRKMSTSLRLKRRCSCITSLGP